MRFRSAERARLVTMEVLRRFEFEPQFMLMSGVIAREGRDAQPQVLLKGSPPEVLPLLDSGRLPEAWSKVITVDLVIKVLIRIVLMMLLIICPHDDHKRATAVIKVVFSP